MKIRKANLFYIQALTSSNCTSFQIQYITKKFFFLISWQFPDLSLCYFLFLFLFWKPFPGLLLSSLKNIKQNFIKYCTMVLGYSRIIFFYFATVIIFSSNFWLQHHSSDSKRILFLEF